MPNSTSSDNSPERTSQLSIAEFEWQTILLSGAIYGGFLSISWFWQSIPTVLLMVAGGWLVAWQGSLQHELIHGHPTRNQWINDAIGWPSLSLWLPYAIYREAHLLHHRDEHLTDPVEDPESTYFTQAAWERMGPVGKKIAEWNMTLLGRLTIGPLVMIISFLAQEASHIMNGSRERMQIWLWHSLSIIAILFWVIFVCKMPLWLYLFGFVYLGAALTRLRSYAEHRYADHHDERTAIVENSSVFGLLFLYNNLHVLHHQRPAIPWYRIPHLYRRDRELLVEINGGLLYDGYLDVARRFLLKPHDDPRHPRHMPKDLSYASLNGGMVADGETKMVEA
ncbi:fatty acid desaturase protein (plasmid) [Rhizobium phaseoli]|uniref:fatty acid desaturase n=1 Tax=Rhizobium phaseoli TaxID=396 RepID=UPI0007F11092|nr:fatty acid desaturase [Rhizobium phaseoli]ANL31863.1 fatty acid desaturase protein [Rhizobium phaseoli]